jgi:hypothetical protein
MLLVSNVHPVSADVFADVVVVVVRLIRPTG